MNHPLVSDWPQPNFVARIGVTGHRPNNPAFCADTLSRTISSVLRRLDRVIRRVHDLCSSAYGAELPCVHMISGIAEGADQLAVSCRPAGWLLDAILPMPLWLYRDDFVDPSRRCSARAETDFATTLALVATILQLPGESEARGASQSYATQGNLLVRHIDLLLAVWDGNPSRGPGGTADVVQSALNEKVPVLWIPLDPTAPPCLVSSPQRDGAADDASILETLMPSFAIDASPTISPHRVSLLSARDERWSRLLAQIDPANGFGRRLSAAALPLLEKANECGLIDLRNLVQAALMLLPIAGVDRRMVEVIAPSACQFARRRFMAMVREVGLPPVALNDEFLRAHLRAVAEIYGTERSEAVFAPSQSTDETCLERVRRHLLEIALNATHH